MAVIHKIHFNDLPEDVKEKLVSAIHLKTDGPASKKFPDIAPPALAAPVRPLLNAFILCVTWAVALAITISCLREDFGATLQPYGGMIGYGFSMLFIIGFPFFMVRHLWLFKALPYRPGVYLFPLHLVDAREPVLKIIPLLADQEIRFSYNKEHKIVLHLDKDITYRFPTPFYLRSKKRVAWAEKKINVFNAVRSLAVDILDHEAEIPCATDLFYTQSKGFCYSTQHSKSVRFGELTVTDPPGFLMDIGWIWRFVFIMALLLGPAVWGLRNLASDHMMLDKARKADTAEAYREYLGKGWQKETVKKTLLPAAVFNAAAKAESVTQLRAFISEFPEHSKVPEARRLIDTCFVNARNAIARSYGPDKTALVLFLQKVIDHLNKKQTPDLKIYISLPEIADIEKADQLIADGEKLKKALREKWRQEGKKDDYADSFGFGEEILNHLINTNLATRNIKTTVPVGAATMTESFSPDQSKKRWNVLTAELNAVFNTLISHDMIRLARTTEKTWQKTEPGIEISYTIQPTGKVYASEGGLYAKKYAGLKFHFTVLLLVPDMASPYGFELTVEPPESFNVEYYSFRYQLNDQPDKNLVYDIMARRAFENLQKTFTEKFYIN